MPAWYHAAFASAALAALAAIGTGSFACGGKPPPARPGVSASKQRPSSSAAPAAHQAAAPRWLSLASLAALPLAAPEPYAVLGHDPGRYSAVIRVSEPARERYVTLTPGSTLPAGSVVAQFTTELESGRAGPRYVMRKDSENAWLFAVLDASGTLVEAGALPLCVRCHGEAPADSLFGLPRAAEK